MFLKSCIYLSTLWPQVGTINARKINEKSTWDAIDSSCVCRSDWKFWLSFEFQWSCVLRLFRDLALIWFAKFLAEFFLLKIAHVLAAVMMMPNTTKRTSPQTPQTGEHHKHHRTHEKSNPIWIVVGGFFTDQGRLRAEGAEPVVPTEAPQQRAGRRGPLRKFGKGIGDRWDCTKIWQRHRGPVRLHNQENTTARRVHDSFRWIHVSLRWIHVYFMCIFINVFINFICVHVFINFIFMQGFSCFFLIVTLTLTSPTVDRLFFLASTEYPPIEKVW